MILKKQKDTELWNLNLKHNWHPCSQMKDYASCPPVVVKKASGSVIELENGTKLIDAISSWWCKSLGHGHPTLRKAAKKQIKQFEHVIFAGTTHKNIIELSKRLTDFLPGLNKVFYAGDGSSAVEIALKMSVQARALEGKKQKNKFVILKNSYHGETAGALSVSEIESFRDTFAPILFDPFIIKDIPYLHTTDDPLWKNSALFWEKTQAFLDPKAPEITAVIVEPIVQGAAGMLLYSQDFLKQLRNWSLRNDVHLIADEIMTGMGRTGTMLACEHANIVPDFLCLSKGLTSGWLPFSAVLTQDKIYDLFYGEIQQAFMHSHTFSGNALGAALALETLKVFAKEKILKKVAVLHPCLMELMHEVANTTKKITNVRGIGGIVAADLVANGEKERIGFEVYKKGLEFGALLRPLGNTVYWAPPLNIDLKTLKQLKKITIQAIESAIELRK